MTLCSSFISIRDGKCHLTSERCSICSLKFQETCSRNESRNLETIAWLGWLTWLVLLEATFSGIRDAENMFSTLTLKICSVHKNPSHLQPLTSGSWQSALLWWRVMLNHTVRASCLKSHKPNTGLTGLTTHAVYVTWTLCTLHLACVPSFPVPN